MDFSQLSEENHDIELSKVFAKIDKIVSPKELKKVKQEKESLIVQLSESHLRIPCCLILLMNLRINWQNSLVII